MARTLRSLRAQRLEVAMATFSENCNPEECGIRVFTVSYVTDSYGVSVGWH